MSKPEIPYRGHNWIDFTTWLSSMPDQTPVSDIIQKLITSELRTAVLHAPNLDAAKLMVKEGAEIVVQFIRFARKTPRDIPLSPSRTLDVCTEIIVALTQQQAELGARLGLSNDEVAKLATQTTNQVVDLTQ